MPFKAVFILGLGEGLFPTTFKKDTLDLRQIPEKINPPIEGRNFRERRIGDVSETERDRYMFLETLISTRKHLVLTYVSHSEMNDDKLNPSSIIQTLLDELNRGYLKNKFKETIHPLKSYSLSYFPELTSFSDKSSKSTIKLPNYNFSSFSQARSYQLRKLFDKDFPGCGRISPALFSPKIKKIFETNLVPSKSMLNESENILKVSITNLRKFLESPLQSSISRLIYFNQEKEDTFNKIEEPFTLERLNEWELLRKIWDHALRLQKNEISLKEGPEWESLYNKFTKRMELEGKMPSSFFKNAMQEKHLKILNNWTKQLTNILNTDWSTLQKRMYKFHFGPIKEGVFNSDIPYNHILRPTISVGNSSFNLGDLSVDIKGSSEWWYSDKQNNWNAIYLNEKENKEKTWLRHFLDILVLQLSGVFSKKTKVSALCISPDEKFKLRNINIPSREEVKKYILNLVHDMQHENATQILPIESILTLSKENLDESNFNIRYYNWIDSKLSLNKENLDISSKFGPVNFLEDFSCPKNPYKIMKRRFDLFFKTILS
ncbi:MAG: hypothetical protein CMI31_05400 [Opitutae bacterium]|nr:hypothetical protein [Opitutae bacterium]